MNTEPETLEQQDPIKCFVGIATYREVHGKTVGALWNAFTSIGGVMWSMTLSSSANVPFNRNKIVEVFLDTDFEYLVFVDQDMLFEPEQLATLIDSIIHTPDAGAVSGMYIKRDGSLTPLCTWVQEDDPFSLISNQETLDRLEEGRGKLVKADLIPTGFMVIRREVFEDLDKPYFYTMFPPGSEEAKDYWSSDSVFCHNLRQAGWETYCHLGIEVGHIGDHVWTPDHFYNALDRIKDIEYRDEVKKQASERYGVNSPEYWDEVWSVENDIGLKRDYKKLHDAIDRYIPTRSGDKVLDLGCGVGQLLEFLNRRHHARTYGLDVSQKAIDICSKKMDPDNFRVMDVAKESIPPAYNKSFDLVFSTEVIEHLDDSGVKKLLRNAWNSLKEGGRFVLSCPANTMGPSVEPEHTRVITQEDLEEWFKDYKNFNLMKIKHYFLAWGRKPKSE